MSGSQKTLEMSTGSADISLILNGLNLASIDLGTVKEAICKIDAQLADNTARLVKVVVVEFILLRKIY